MNKKIKASVAILTLNSGETLERCLESVKDFEEIVICDGNSTDDTLDIASKFNAKVVPQFDSKKKNQKIKDKAKFATRHWSHLAKSGIFGWTAMMRSLQN